MNTNIYDRVRVINPETGLTLRRMDGQHNFVDDRDIDVKTLQWVEFYETTEYLEDWENPENQTLSVYTFRLPFYIEIILKKMGLSDSDINKIRIKHFLSDHDEPLM